MKWIKRIFKILGFLVLLLLTVYLLGPNPSTPNLTRDIPDLGLNLAELDLMVKQRESADSIRPGCGAEIVFASEPYQKTPYAIVYLPGFTATKMEGEPLHREFAKRYGCNLYLARLEGHGVHSDNPMLGFTPEGFINSAREAIAIGLTLGDSVILMTCSTGGTAGIFLAPGEPRIAGLINYSPNVRMARFDSYFLNKPWGLQIARQVFGGDFYSYEDNEENQQYWYTRYRIEALVQLQELVEATMYDYHYEQVTVPFFMGYYMRDEEHKDHVVSIPAMLEMYDQLGTADARKRKVNFTNAEAHVICSKLKSKDLEAVRAETFKFAEEIMQLVPVSSR